MDNLMLRRRLMMVAKGIWQTVTAATPLILQNTLKSKMRSLIQYGKMVQDGTPAPASPVMPVINNGTVRMVHRSGLPSGFKLLDCIGSNGLAYLISDVYLASTDVVEAEFRNSSTTGYGALYGVFKLGDSSALYANQNYYSYDESNNKVDTDIRVNTEWHTSRHDFVNGTLTIDGITVNFTPWEFTNTNPNAILARYYNNSYGYIWKGYIRKFKVIRGGEVICDMLPAKNTQDEVGLYDLISGNFYTATGGTLVAGDEVNDYEPAVVGDTETLTVVGNLLSRDGETKGKIIGADGTVSDNSSYCISAPFVLPAGNYTCAWNVGSAGTKPFSVSACDADGTPKTDGRIFYKARTEAGINTGEFTVEAKTLVVASYRSNVTDLAIYSNAQTASVLDLYAVGDYADEVDVVSGTVTRRVKRYIFDGTEEWTQPSGTDYFRLDGLFADAIPYATSNPAVVCSHFMGRPSSTSASGMADGDIKLGYTSGYNRLYLKYAAMADANALKAFFAEQYAAGTPVIMWYPLAEPYTESIIPQKLSTVKGVTVIHAATPVAPVSVKATYLTQT